MIKPSDIPEDLARFAASWSDISPRQSRDMISAILNAAIESGIVSPPVYCVRWSGILQTRDGELVLHAGKPWAHDTEHWKGQTQ